MLTVTLEDRLKLALQERRQAADDFRKQCEIARESLSIMRAARDDIARTVAYTRVLLAESRRKL